MRFNRRQFWVGIAAAIIFCLVFFTRSSESQTTYTNLSSRSSIQNSTLALAARAALVLDLSSNQVIFAKNTKTQLPIASITKLMTALVAAEDLANTLQSSVNYANTWWSISDLIDWTLLTSSNNGAMALAAAATGNQEVDFVEQMNQTAARLNLNQTYFINETGLDLNPWQGGAYSSAQDVAQLVRHLLTNHFSLVEATRKESVTKTSLDNQSFFGRNTNDAVAEIPGLIMSKTGFTDLANGNLALAFDRGLNQPVIVVVLGSTPEGRFSDVKNLVQAVFDFYSKGLVIDQ